MNIVSLSINYNYATKIANLTSYPNVVFIVRKYFKGINYKINKLIYKDIPYSKAKE